MPTWEVIAQELQSYLSGIPSRLHLRPRHECWGVTAA